MLARSLWASPSAAVRADEAELQGREPKSPYQVGRSPDGRSLVIGPACGDRCRWSGSPSGRRPRNQTVSGSLLACRIPGRHRGLPAAAGALEGVVLFRPRAAPSPFHGRTREIRRSPASACFDQRRRSSSACAEEAVGDLFHVVAPAAERIQEHSFPRPNLNLSIWWHRDRSHVHKRFDRFGLVQETRRSARSRKRPTLLYSFGECFV